MMKRPTLQDVAREAGVGTATVGRVLNTRGNVRAELTEKVIRAAKALGYGDRRPGLHQATIRIEVILLVPQTELYVRLNRAFKRISASLDPSIILHRTFLNANDVVGIARHITQPTFRRAGLIAVVSDHPVVAESIRQVRLMGTEVVQLLTKSIGDDVPYVGIDQYRAGRTAAFYMSHMTEAREGAVVALCHSGSYWAQRERIRGFSDYLEQHANARFEFPLTMIGYDDNVRIAEILRDAVQGNNVIGLYNAGTASEGIASVLGKWPQKVTWIGHTLTPNTTHYLRSGLMDIIIDPAPDMLARRSVDVILSRLGLIDLEGSSEPEQFLTITAENLPMIDDFI